ncbi:HlyD family type I secretion periplasmic adaptor subunit [Piscinibacter terrae]|uniref:Membrane fusion protein (MFP) family protein n=1 Tax=Piscinibacter terrae TaxID=2496871 RepID=A0A3N7IX68_9BURK|nr:HlyD family type I secretion periplasmic adaptor subunit [Albitalea terrae]RQP23372.1 HlyD family type I secretion periplasmic adaptor subunit [Albitalea terrae]
MSETMRHPALELMGRYKAVFKAAWAMRHELTGPKRMADEVAFLPAALSLQETPSHPAPRRATWVICALFVIALTWAIFGQIDIVAVAPGRIVVSDSSKTVQPLESGVVKRVLVKDGDLVQAGQVLIELDATNASADKASVQEQWAAAVSEERRTTALMESLRTGRPPGLSGTDAPTQAQLSSEYQDITAKLAKLGAEQARRSAETATVRETIAKLEATLPIAQQREADFKRLTEQGFMSSHAGQDRTRERIEQERDLATQRARLLEAQAAAKETENAKASYLAETQRQLNERQAQARSKREQLAQERSKTEQRSRLTQLTAPVTGTVQQLAIHTEGGVVTPAQVLMVVVPKDAQVTAEVIVDNRDIGFVNAGQSVQVKLETFPYTRYGTIEAKVDSVTADAVNDEKRGAIFPATLRLAKGDIDVDGKRIRISPGMNVTAEVKTGKRRVIDYLLSPIERATSESLKER